MGAGSSTSKSRVLTKVQVVAALTAKSNERKDEQKANEQEWKQADKFVTKASIRRDNHRVQYNDTTNAWKALDGNWNHEVLSAKKSEQSSKGPLSKQISTASTTKGKDEDVQRQLHTYGVVRKLIRDEDCFLCGTAGTYKGPCHGCRICDKLYHNLCLEQKGHLRDELSSKALAESETTVGWSCPDCENIFDLLTENEKSQVIEAFDNMVGNDTSVDLEKYIRHKKESYSNLVGIAMTSQRENQEVRVFNDLDRDASGTLEWWEFAPSMCLRILSKRSQAKLASLLTNREINKLESFFKIYDADHEGKLKISEAKCAYLKWFLSLIKRDDENHIPLAWTGDLPPGWLGAVQDGYTGKEAELTWRKFLDMMALHVIGARPNTVDTRPYVPTVNEAIQVELDESDVGLKMKPARVENDASEITEVTDPIARIKMRLKNKDGLA